MERNTELEELRTDEALAELLGKASPRPAPPAADEVLIRQAVHAEWRKVTGGHVRRRHITSFALAASVLLAVFATLNLLRDPAVDVSGQQLATVQKHIGDVSVNGRFANAKQVALFMRGDVLETRSASGLALGWHDGGSLRIDEDTVVVFEAANQIYLKQGRVYFDSEAGPLSIAPANSDAVEFMIRTDLGVLRHLGTQYMAEAGADELILSVREGVVSIDGDVTARASAGQKFAISESGELSINATDGVDDWGWIEKTTPAVNVDGRFVAEALAWVQRESGFEVRYSSPAVEALARTETLHGDYDMEPRRALELFMMTVDLTVRIEGNVILISED